ncbi:tape measure protein [Gordonia phage Ghobes]|uniref:Tape measure protein n=1 Tax=Gordonia phage Ghobes TaxID=1887647 RepID=A0A1B3B020_9CAUD|nr:tail length tape measure protein [Gordonia phage Ghobes]AOE44367.1 tape measure protein [Gordonia phage Ghobes]
MAVRGIWVPVYPSLRNFGATIVREASGAAQAGSNALQRGFRQGGQRAGQAAGEAAAQGLRQQQAAVERASRQLAGARQAEADAAGQVRVAEAALADVRGNANATAAQLARAEEQAAKARRDHEARLNGVSQAERDLEALRDGATAASRNVVRAEQQLEQARNAVATANGQVRVAEVELETLRNSGNATSAQLTRAEERLERARRSAAGAADQVTTANLRLRNAQNAAEQETEQGTQATEEAGEAASGLGGKLGELAKKYGALAGAAAGVTGLGAAFANSFNVEAVNDKLAAQLGATPELAADLGTVAGNVYANAFGEDLASVNEGIRAVWQNGLVEEDATNAQLESITQKALGLASVFDQDVAGASAAAGTLIKNGLVADSNEAFDLLTRGFQQGVDKGEDFLDTLTEYPTLFKALGLSGQEATGLLSQGLAAGARNSDVVADALKEFQIRATDGSKASAAAFEALGFNAAQMTAQIAGGGEGAKNGLDAVLDRLRAVEDPVLRSQAAVGLFGTKAEDLAASLLALDPTTAAKGLGDVAGAADRMNQTMGDNAATRIESFKRTVENLSTALAGGVLGGLKDAAEFVGRNKEVFLGLASAITVFVLPALVSYAAAQAQAAAASVASGIASLAGSWRTLGAALRLSTVFTWAQAAAQWALNSALLANPLTWLVVALVAVGVALWAFFTKTETGRAIVTAVWNAIKTAMGAVVNWWTATAWPALKRGFDAFLNAGKVLWSGLQVVFNGLKAGFNFVAGVVTWWWQNVTVPAFNAVKRAAELFWQGLQTVFNFVKQGFQLLGDGATAAKDTVVRGFNAVVDFVTGLPGRISNAAKGLFDGFKEAFRGAINWIIRAWNSLEFKIPGFELGPVKFGGFTLGLPDLPELKGGGRVQAGRTKDGQFWGPGTGTSDSLVGVNDRGFPVVRVANGEGVVREDVMRNGGARLVAGLNSGALDPRSLPGLAEGGVVGNRRSAEEVNEFPRKEGLEGSPYNWGGVHWGDCSGTQSAVARFAVGLDPWGGRFATGNQEEALTGFGFKLGQGPEGSLRIGWKNGGPAGGHTSGTLPDGTNYEMGGNRGNGQVGGQAAPWNDSYFNRFAFLELEKPKSYSETNPYDSGTPAPDQVPAGVDLGGSSGSSSSTGGNGGSLPTLGQLAGQAVTEQLDDLADFFGFKDTWLYDPSKLGISTGGEEAKNSGTSVSTATPPKVGSDKTEKPKETLPPGATQQEALPPPTTEPPKTDKELVQLQFKPYGWDTGVQWSAVDWLVNKESSWNKDAENPSSGAYGYFQFLGSTRQQYLPQPSPVPADVQGRAGAKYLKDRYKLPTEAKAFHEKNNWYDQGGLASGLGLLLKGVRTPERVLSPSQTADFERLVDANFRTPLVDAAFATPDLPGDDDTSNRRGSGRGGDAPLVGTLTVQAVDVEDQVRQVNRTLRTLAKSDTLLGGWG